jgi:hypothetical protein
MISEGITFGGDIERKRHSYSNNIHKGRVFKIEKHFLEFDASISFSEAEEVPSACNQIWFQGRTQPSDLISEIKLFPLQYFILSLIIIKFLSFSSFLSISSSFPGSRQRPTSSLAIQLSHSASRRSERSSALLFSTPLSREAKP